MMRTVALLVLVLGCCGNALAEPLNYDYVYLSSSETEHDNGEETSGEVFGAFYSFKESLHGFLSFDEGGSYSTAAGDSRSLRAGAGGHFYIADRLIIAPSIAILHTRVDVDNTVMMRSVYGKQYLQASHLGEQSDTGYQLQLDTRWNFLDRWEIIGGLHYSEIFDQGDTEIVAGLLWHPLDWLALGAIGKEKSEARAMELTARWYF